MKRLTSWLIIFAIILSSFVPVGSVSAESTEVESGELTDGLSLVAVKEAPVAVVEPVSPSSEANLDQALTIPSNALNPIPDGELVVQSTESVDSPVEDATLIDVPPKPVVLPASPIIIAGYKASEGRLDAVRIFNNSSDLIAIEDWAIRYSTNSEEFEFGLPDAWLLSKNYAVFAWAGQAENADAEYSFDAAVESGGVVSIELLPPSDSFAKDSTSLPADYSNKRMRRYTSSAGNYTTNTTFIAVDDKELFSSDGLYIPPTDTAVSIVEILPNSRNCSPIDENLACGDYVKLSNPTDQPINLDGLRLRSGYRGQTSGIANTIKLKGVLQAGEFATVTLRDDSEFLNITNSGGFVWIEDTHGLTVYESTIVEYPDASTDKYKNQSWALDEVDNAWKWGVPSPYGANEFAVIVEPTKVSILSNLVPCRDDQYRSEETNRCRNIVSAITQALCKEGQYRNEETGRCRNVSSTAGLVACRDDQYRSEETNRCRNLVTTASIIKPCKDNQYRSEETNRCRNIVATSVPEAAFAVEPIADTGEAFMGWWALGGVGALAAGYGGWEWRREITLGARKFGSFFTSGK